MIPAKKLVKEQSSGKPRASGDDPYNFKAQSMFDA